MDRENLKAMLKHCEDYNSKYDGKPLDINKLADYLIANGIGDITAEKHRADVAEEALKLACEKAYDIRVSMDTLSCSSCWLFEEHGMCYTHDKFEAGSECYDKWQEHFIQQAEARLKGTGGTKGELKWKKERVK